MIGEQVGSYQIIGELGRGGMGAVYRARHVTLGREAAVKVLLPQYSANADVVQRFFNEAKAATSIHHLGIVEIYDYGLMPNGVAYIAMELLLGESLAHRMHRTRLAPTAVLQIARQICGALGAAHAAGIVHRDLKPDNVYLVRDDEVAGGERIKLLDFGIAKVRQDQQSQSQTRTGSLMGTPTYMSPEQCRGVKVDHRTDIYALGCIVFEMVTRRTVFVGEGVGDVLGAHMYAVPPALDSLVSDLPPGLSSLVAQLLAKDPARRPQTTADVVRAIDALGAATGSLPPAARSHDSLAQPPAHATTLSSMAHGAPTLPARGSRWTVIAGVTVLAVGAVVAALVMMRTDPPDAPAAPAPPAPALASAAPPAPVVDAAVADAAPAPDAAAEVEIALDTVPPGAAVTLDGANVGVTPYHARIAAGDGTVRYTLRAKGYRDAAVEAPRSEGVSRVVTLEPVEKPRQRPAASPTKPPVRKPGDDDAVNPYR